MAHHQLDNITITGSCLRQIRHSCWCIDGQINSANCLVLQFEQVRNLPDIIPVLFLTRMGLASLYITLGRYSEALVEAEAAEASMGRTMGASHWYTALAKSVHGSILGKLGRNEEAEDLLVGSYEQMAEDDSAASVYVDRSLQRLIDFYRESGNQEALAAEP